jgi:acyl dehydratase
MAGRYFDEWTVGDRIAHEIRRTVTETDNLLFSTLSHNPQPLHLDADYAAGTEFGRIVVNGTFTFALTIGLSVGDTTLGTLVANLGYDKVTMPASGREPLSFRATTSVSARSVSPMKTGLGMRTLS